MRWPSIKVSILFIAVFLGLWFLMPSHSKAQVSGAHNSISVETVAGDSVAKTILNNAHTSWPWYVARGTGLLAAMSLVILMLSGIGQITGHTYKFLEPLSAWASHRALGFVFGVSVLLHIVSLLFDKFMKFTLLQALVPWLANFKPSKLFGHNVGSMYLAFGIISFYLSIAVIVTSIVWVSKKPHIWKFVHLLSYLLIALVFVHALFTGTDLASGWLRLVWIASGVAILYGTIVRLWRAYTA
jgi:predicted ferric reductase